MASTEVAALAVALASTLLAFLLPWLQRENGFPVPWERKTVFGLLLVDAAVSWILLGQMRMPPSSVSLVSVTLLVGANVGFGLYLTLRGFTLPAATRWTAVVALVAIEPLFLVIDLALQRIAPA